MRSPPPPRSKAKGRPRPKDSPALARELLTPVLGRLLDDDPELDLALTSDPALALLQRGEADMALWLTDDPPEDLIGRPLGQVMACAYATPEYVAGTAAGALQHASGDAQQPPSLHHQVDEEAAAADVGVSGASLLWLWPQSLCNFAAAAFSSFVLPPPLPLPL